VSISEIQPASPRVTDEDAEGHRMTLEDGRPQKETGARVLTTYVEDRTNALVDWCRNHQGIAGTIVVSAAAMGIAILTSLAKRR
jgi:hypothetical protein